MQAVAAARDDDRGRRPTHRSAGRGRRVCGHGSVGVTARSSACRRSGYACGSLARQGPRTAWSTMARLRDAGRRSSGRRTRRCRRAAPDASSGDAETASRSRRARCARWTSAGTGGTTRAGGGARCAAGAGRGAWRGAGRGEGGSGGGTGGRATHGCSSSSSSSSSSNGSGARGGAVRAGGGAGPRRPGAAPPSRFWRAFLIACSMSGRTMNTSSRSRTSPDIARPGYFFGGVGSSPPAIDSRIAESAWMFFIR